jgi:type IV secretory pathway VirB2 component (pilin)
MSMTIWQIATWVALPFATLLCVAFGQAAWFDINNQFSLRERIVSLVILFFLAPATGLGWLFVLGYLEVIQ